MQYFRVWTELFVSIHVFGSPTRANEYVFLSLLKSNILFVLLLSFHIFFIYTYIALIITKRIMHVTKLKQNCYMIVVTSRIDNVYSEPINTVVVISSPT